MRRRADRQARFPRRRHQNRNAAGTIAAAAISFEQIETYERQRAAAEKLKILNEAQAQAKMQTELTNTRVQVQIAESHGEADLARARKQAEQTVVVAEADLARSRRQAEQTVVLAEADSKQRELAGRGEAQKIAQVGFTEAAVLLRRIASYRDPKLYAMSLLAEQLSKSSQPLVPQRVFIAGGGNGAAGNGADHINGRSVRHLAQPAGRRKIGLPNRQGGPGPSRNRRAGRKSDEASHATISRPRR